MNCRKVNSLLSAYIDAELPREEMEAVREHLTYCSACRLEHETFLQTKRAVASLANRVSREEIARLLADSQAESRPLLPSQVRVNPIAVTALLSLAGLWLATSALDRPGDGGRPVMLSGYEPVTVTISTGSVTPVLAAVPPSGVLYPVNMGGSNFSRAPLVRHFVRSGSLRETIGRVFGLSRNAPPGITVGGGVLQGSELPIVRVMNGRENGALPEASLLQGPVTEDRYLGPTMFH